MAQEGLHVTAYIRVGVLHRDARLLTRVVTDMASTAASKDTRQLAALQVTKTVCIDAVIPYLIDGE